MNKLTHTIHHADGSKEEKETTLYDLNIFLRDKMNLELLRLNKRIDWLRTGVHIVFAMTLSNMITIIFLGYIMGNIKW